MKKKTPAKKLPLFDPDSISTEIHQALERDYAKAQHAYCLNDDITLYAFNRQVNEFRKKYVTKDLDVDRLSREAIERFRSTNSHMLDYNIKLIYELSAIPDRRIQRDTPRMEKIHKRARALMHSVLGPFDRDEWFTSCRNSSGSSIGVPFSDTSIEKKFTLPMSVTEDVVPLFDEYLSDDFQLSDAIAKNNSKNPVMDRYKIVRGSRATTVEKSVDKRRFISVEPTCNMFLQQGLMHMMYRRMKTFGLDVESLPDIHKESAKISSITGCKATIDWSNASDCVSIELLRWLLPPAWFDVVDQVRSKYSSTTEGEVELQMISTMGNAVTFPLETLVFWTYAHAIRVTDTQSTLSLYPEYSELVECSVFGDDCIVPTSIAPAFIQVLTSVGFMINDEKSYYGTEQFRESCGGDYLSGYDVRPYCIRSPRSTSRSAIEPWLYTVTNALVKKYMTYFGELSYVYDKELFRTLFSLFRRYQVTIKLVPSYFPDDAGLKLSYDILRFHRHYPMKLSRIKCNMHGTYAFNYCRFVYRTKAKKCSDLSVWDWLKFPVLFQNTLRKPTHDYSVRRIGGYVVAKGISCQWYVPDVSSAS